MDEFWRAFAAHGDTYGIGALLVTTIGIILRALSTGRLVFANQLDELTERKDAEVERIIAYYDKLENSLQKQVDDWRAAHNIQSARADAQTKTLDDMLELARAADQMLRALPSSRPSGEK